MLLPGRRPLPILPVDRTVRPLFLDAYVADDSNRVGGLVMLVKINAIKLIIAAKKSVIVRLIDLGPPTVPSAPTYGMIVCCL
jgi:hypothetical protein